MIGAVLAGKYRIDQLLGEGGMGAVYLAENVAIGRTVAIKLLHAALARDPALLARFRQEARAAAAIGHPGIVEVLDLGQTEDGAEFIVMERLEGETLGHRLEREGRLPIDDAVAIMDRILDALGAAHDKGIVHRDLKPDNVFLVARPVAGVKLLDFGISKLHGAEDARLTQTGALMGTPLYMSPEQARGAHDAGPAADFYSAGAILYHMLAGAPPFLGDSVGVVLAKLMSEPHRPLEQVRPDAPAHLASLVDCLLTKSPEVRIQTAASARDMLHGAPVGASPDSSLVPVSPGPSPPPPPRARWPLALGAGLALAAGVWMMARGRLHPVAPAAPVAVAPPAPAAAPQPQAQPPPPPAPREVVLTLAPVPADAALELDGRALDCARPCPVRSPAGSRHQIGARAHGYVTRTMEVVFDGERQVPIRLDRASRAASASAHPRPAAAADRSQPKSTAPGILDEDLRSSFPRPPK
jgi:serine/threonine-protein kinase